MRFTYFKRKMAKLFANSGDPDQMLHSVGSDLGMHYLPVTLLWASGLQWVKPQHNQSEEMFNKIIQEGQLSFWQKNVHNTG